MTPTDEKPMTVEALMKNMCLAWYLGQRYRQQADSESYADNKRSVLTLEEFNKLLEASRAAIEQYGREQYARLTDLNSELTDKANQYLIENARLDRELAAANAEKKALQESLASEKKWGELWYFVSDEEPLAFETIVTQHAPKRWIDQAYNLMAAHTLRKGMT